MKKTAFYGPTVLSTKEPKIWVDSHKIQRSCYKIQSHIILKQMKSLDLMLTEEAYFSEEGHAHTPKVAKWPHERTRVMRTLS